MGVIQEDNRTVPGLKAGEHTLRAEKGRQYQPNQKPVELSAGQTSDLDLRLAILPVPVEITKRPADSIVTYTRAGDATVRTVTGTRLELPEGNYTFRADAKGYLQKIVTNEHVSWDSIHPIDLTQAVAPRDFTMADWDKGFWTPKNGSFEGKAGVFILFPKQLSFVQFAVRTQGVKTYAHWILHYVNEKNYIQCIIDDEGFRATRISDAKKDVIATKKGVPKSEWYQISIEIRSDGAILTLLRGGVAELLGEIAEPGFGETKFGFYAAPGQQLFLSSFLGRPL
jgi:hypothetical protein